jgi:hypothetical protein
VKRPLTERSKTAHVFRLTAPELRGPFDGTEVMIVVLVQSRRQQSLEGEDAILSGDRPAIVKTRIGTKLEGVRLAVG